MAAISASLLAASAQTGNPGSPAAAATGGIDFASLLLAVSLPTQATSAIGQAPPATTALPEELTESVEPTDSADATTAGGVLVAGGLLTLPAAPLPATTTVAATPAPPIPVTLTAALPTPVTTADQVPATATPVPTAEVVPTESRTEQLRLTTAPAARPPTNTSGVTQQSEPKLPQLPGEPTADRRTAPTTDRATVRLPVPATPTPTQVEGTPAVALSPRTPTVVPQVPVIAERSQQLPALPPEIGYSLVRPELTAPAGVKQVAEVGVGGSQAQIEATVSQFTTAQSKASSPVPATNTGAAFETVLATRTPAEPSATGPAPEVVPAVGTPVPQATVVPDSEPPTADPRVGFRFAPVAPTQIDSPANVAVPTATRFTRELTAGETAEPTIDAGRQVRTDAVLTAQPPVAGTEPPQTAPRVNATAPAVAAQVSEAFVTHAQVLVKDGRHEFQLRLDPPELGEVKVRMLATGDKVEARLVVTDDAVKHLIESQLPELRQRLEAAGISVPQFDVTTDGGGRASGDERWEQPQPGFAQAPKTAAPTTRTPARPTAAGGLIDVTA